MNKRGCVVMCHGWAYGPSLFDPFLHWVREQHPALWAALQWVTVDLGYGTATAPSNPGTLHYANLSQLNPAECVAIGHSLGFAKLLEHSTQWAHVVSVGGFTHFCSQPKAPEGIAPRVLDRMIKLADMDLPTVLADFQTRCGLPLPNAHSSRWNGEALLSDLHLLKSIDVSTQLTDHIQAKGLATSLEFSEDAIVPASLSAACFQGKALRTTTPGPHAGLGLNSTGYTGVVSAIERALN